METHSPADDSCPNATAPAKTREAAQSYATHHANYAADADAADADDAAVAAAR